jgi:hypothetical protein
MRDAGLVATCVRMRHRFITLKNNITDNSIVSPQLAGRLSTKSSDVAMKANTASR